MPSGLLAQQPRAAHMAAGRHDTISLKICSVDCVPSLCVSFFTCEMQMAPPPLGSCWQGAVWPVCWAHGPALYPPEHEALGHDVLPHLACLPVCEVGQKQDLPLSTCHGLNHVPQ